jgi:hypothetical protein
MFITYISLFYKIIVVGLILLFENIGYRMWEILIPTSRSNMQICKCRVFLQDDHNQAIRLACISCLLQFRIV